ncbi:MAG TPA: trigger factor [Myxococcota bacterium]|nr:trigger factor [Myxococcota bacterium]
MTAESASAGELHVEAREDGPVARRLEVRVPAARVAAAFARAYREIGKTARVRGFRPGRTPVSVLRRLYGAAVAEDVERALVAETLPAALEQSSIVPVSDPSVDADHPEESAPFVYRARIEVKPSFALGDVKGLPAKRISAAVGEEDVERELEALRQRHAPLIEEPEATPTANGHLVTLDYTGRIGGQMFEGGSARDLTVELGSGRLPPGFEEQLAGARAGEERTVRVRFPDDFANPALAGQEAEFAVRVVSVRRRELPALDDEFAKDLGDFESLAQVRARIRESLERAREQRARSELRRTLLDALIERVPFEVPSGLVHERLHRRLHSARHELEERSLRRDLLERQLAHWEEEWRPAIEREVREEWLLQEVAREQGFAVDDPDVERHLAKLAEEQGSDAARLLKAYRQAGALEAVRERLLEDKAVEFLLAEAKVEDAAGP